MAKKKAQKKTFRVTKRIRDAVIAEVAGEDTLNVVEFLKGKENVSEFIVAEELEEEINLIRNKLYRLLQANLVSFTRKKDKQKGWYIYYWTLKLQNVKFLHFDLKRKRLDALKDRLSREEANFYFTCSDNCIRLDFDQALSFDYHCPECGQVLSQEDNQETIKNIQEEIDTLQKEVEELRAVQ